MKIVKKLRTKSAKITIYPHGTTMTISNIFIRNYNIFPDKLNLTFGYDRVFKKIGLSFSKERDVNSYRLNFIGGSSRNATVSVSALIKTTDLTVDEIAGIYEGDAIEGPVEIEGFSDSGFLLHIDKRSKINGSK
jgi:hypothetical protein